MVLLAYMVFLAGFAATLLPAQTPSAIKYGCAIIAQDQIRESQALAKVLRLPTIPNGAPKVISTGNIIFPRQMPTCPTACTSRPPGTVNLGCRWS